MVENFQDNITYGGSTLAVSGDAVIVGSTNAGAKSIIFNNSGSQGHLAWQPTAARTINLPDSGGTIQLTGQAPGAIYDGANSITSGTIRFTNANGVSFSINGQTLSGSVAAQTVQTVGLYALGNTTQNSSTTLDARTLSFNGLGNITVGYSNGSIQISGAGGGGASVNFSAGTTSNNLASVTFSNSNGVSFGLNGSTITGSVAVQTNQTIGLYGLGNTTQNSSTTLDARTLSFNGLGAATVGYSNGSIQISVPTQSNQTQSNIQAFYDGANSISTGTIRFTNANGVSFSVNGQTISGSVAAQTVQTVGLYAVSNTTGASSSSTFDARSISFQGAGVASVGYSNGSVVISVPSGGGAGDGVNIIAAGTQTANTTGTVLFSNSNGVTFGMSNSSIVTASVAAQTVQTVGLYALGNTTQNSSTTLDARTLSFNGLGNITVGYSNGSIQISGAGGGGGVAQQAGTQTATSGTVVFSNSNGISFGMSNSSIITASFNGTLNSVVFSNSNNVTFGSAGNTTITASFGQTNQTVGLYALGNTTQNSSTTLDARTLSFNGLGIITAGYSNGSIQISATQSNQVISVFGLGNTTQSSSRTMDARSFSFNGLGIVSVGMTNGSIQISATQSADTVGLYAVSNTTQNSSTTLDARTLSFNGAGGVSVGYSNGSIVISGGAGGGGGVAISGGANSTSTGTVVFSNSNGISFGLSANGVMTASVAAVAGSDIVFSNSNNIVFGKNVSTVTASANPPTISKSYALAVGSQSSSVMALGSVSFRYLGIDQYISISRLDIPVLISLSSSGTTNTAALAITSGCVIYTLNGSTLSPIVGQIASTTYTWASGTSNFSNISGFRPISFGLATLLTPGDYWVGFQLSTNTSSVGLSTTSLGNTISIMLGSLFSASNYADIGVATSNNSGLFRLQGMCATTISNTTMTFNETQLTLTGATGFRANYNIILRNY